MFLLKTPLEETAAYKQLVSIGEKRGERIGEKRGERIGEKRGERIGEKKGKLTIARALKKKGIDVNLLVETTGFSRKEIEE